MEALDACQVFVLWPQPIRRGVEGEALCSLAGDVAKELFAPAFGRVLELVTVRAAMVAEELPPLPEDERAKLIQAVNNESGRSDAENVAKWAVVAVMIAVEVPGLLVAKQGDDYAVTFEMDGHAILIRPSYSAKPGTIVRKGSKVAKAHPGCSSR